MKDLTAKRLSALHRVLFRVTGGKVGHRLIDNDMLLLTTTGRHSGSSHSVPLLYLTEGDSVVVIASWGGRPHHPDWYHNLVADPDGEIQIDRERRRVRARTTQGEERADLWERVVHAYAGYREYQSKTDRLIPVVVLDPV